jgi:hypothetical protein
LARGSKISTVEILLFPSYPPTANLKHKLSCFSVHNNEADYASLGLQQIIGWRWRERVSELTRIPS